MKIVYLFLITTFFMIGITSCVSYRKMADMPEPRPLGKEIPAIQAMLVTEKEIKDKELMEEPKGVLDLGQALRHALLKNPELETFSWEIRAREAAAIQAALYPNPEFEIELENLGGSGAFKGMDATETTISLGQLIELAGKREKRTKVAALQSDLAAWDYEAKRLDVFTEVVKSFVQVLAVQEQVNLNEELVKLAEEFLLTINKRVEAGRVSPAEASRAKVELSMTGIGLVKVIKELEASRKRLAASWGSTKPIFEKAEGDLGTFVEVPPFEKLKKYIGQNPDIARWQVVHKHRQAILELEKAGSIPDPTIIGGFRRINETKDNAFVVGLSIPLPLFDRNQGGIQESQFRLHQSQKEKLNTQISVLKELTDNYSMLSATFNEVTTLNSKILPEAQNAYKIISQGYLLGKFGFLDVLDAQRTLFEARGGYLNALREYHQVVADIERLIGQSLDKIE